MINRWEWRHEKRKNALVDLIMGLQVEMEGVMEQLYEGHRPMNPFCKGPAKNGLKRPELRVAQERFTRRKTPQAQPTDAVDNISVALGLKDKSRSPLKISVKEATVIDVPSLRPELSTRGGRGTMYGGHVRKAMRWII